MALYRLAQAAAKRWPTAVALRSQTEALTLDFGTLERRAAATAAVLQSRGLEAGQVLISDLQNTSQNLVVQLACSSLGVAYGTAKSGVGMMSMGVMNPQLVMKNIIPVVMAGILGIYGLIVAVILPVVAALAAAVM